jgi:hypothetical protein
MSRQIICNWCDKKWEWDSCTDEIPGASFRAFMDSSSSTRLFLYWCTCGGSLAVVTEEVKGSTLLEYRPDEG